MSFVAQALSHELLTFPSECFGILSPHLCSVHVGGTFIVGATQHADDGDEDGLRRLHGRPSFRSRFISILVVFGRVEDGDADFARGVEVGMEDWGFELHLGREKRILGWEGEASAEEASCKW